MSSALKWKLVAGFLLVFIAGGAVGVFVTMTIGRQMMFAQHQPGVIAQTMKNRLRWQLRLTDEQMAKIAPIIDKTASQLAEIRGDTGKKVRETIAESHREIAQYLTPEQQQRLKQMEERRQQWMQLHHGPGGPGRPGPWRRGPNANPPAPQNTPSPETSPSV